MNSFKRNKHRAQALLEVTMLASILLFLLSVIVRTGVMSNERQKFFMESFKDAIARASSDHIQKDTLNFQGDYFRNVKVPDIASHSGVQNLEQMQAAWNVKRTDRLNYAAGTNYQSMNRKHYIFDSASGMKELNRPTIAGDPDFMSGFTTEGFKEAFSLPLYDIPVPYKFADTTKTEKMYCFRYKMPDPEDIYPADGIYWSWVAVCGKEWKFMQDKEVLKPGDGSGIPFFHANCERCESDNSDSERIFSAYVADTPLDANKKPGAGSTPCHPASSADSLDGVRFYGEDDLRFEYYMYFQSAYDPSVPLGKDFMAFMHCYDTDNSVHGDYKFSICDWKPDQLETGQWILFAFRTMKNGQFLQLLNGQLRKGPFISRGKQIWLSFDDLAVMRSGSTLESSMLNDEKFKKAVAYSDTVQYVSCDATVGSDGKVTTPSRAYGCGGNFTIASLRSSTCPTHSWRLKTGEDNEVQFWFGNIDGLDLKHSVWGDIDMNAASSRVQEQGIQGYRLKSTVDINVTTEGTGSAIDTETNVKVKDTIVRKLKTNPFGRLFGGTSTAREHGEFDITQERNLTGTLYDYEVQ